MLRTYTLTLSATDAIVGFPGACPNQVVIEHFRTVIFLYSLAVLSARKMSDLSLFFFLHRSLETVILAYS